MTSTWMRILFCLVAMWFSGLLGMTDRVAAAGGDEDIARVAEQIDAAFEQAQQAAGIEAGSIADDAMFLRRIQLDLQGGIPGLGQARLFLGDTDADKRSRLIDRLVAEPQHATHLAQIWRDVLLPRNVGESVSGGFEQWLQSQFRDKVPYDVLVRKVLLAQGGLGQSPEVLYYAALNTSPSALAASTSQVFLGIQIRCAECHDHPFADWKQDDFWGYAAFFGRLSGPVDMNGAPLMDLPSGEVRHPVNQRVVAPRLLSASEDIVESDLSRRELLGHWMTSDSNPYFARATVNRVWSLMFGRGLVEPVDDLDDQRNPPSHPEVLDLLARDFAAHDFNLGRLFRILARTKAYQRASAEQVSDEQLRTYAVMPVRSLSPKQVYASLVQAAGRRTPLSGDAARVEAQRLEFLAQIEAPTRRALEFQGGIPQTLTMLNGPLVDELTSPATSDLLAALLDSPFLDDGDRIDAVFLSTLTRYPSPQQRARVLEWMQDEQRQSDSARALSDLLWALMNSSDFMLNR